MATTAERPSHRYRIVIALDRSEYAEIVLTQGLDQAARHDAPDLHVVTIVNKGDDEIAAAKTWLAANVLDGLDNFRQGRDDWRTRLHVRRGRAEEEITDLAAEIRADLIVVGRFGIHHRDRSVAEAVIAKATCPTLVVGLVGHEAESVAQCPACVTVREESEGNRWFCEDHTDHDRLRMSTLLPHSISGTGGGPLW